MHSRIVLIGIIFAACVAGDSLLAEDLSNFKQNQPIADFRVANLYTDSNGRVIAAKFWHTPSKAPVYVLQIETAPQSFMWIDTPATSNRGVAHSLEHLLVRKGTKGRYLSLLRTMRYSQSGAATYQDYNFYCLTSGTGMPGFMEQFHALLDALYRPDFSDVEAEREFYHLGISTDRATKKKQLVEQGTVYNEMQTGQGIFTYYFELNKRVFGETNPFSFNVGGVPDEMRDVTPSEIRHFHARHYQLGPGTGFIFVLPPKEHVLAFLTRLSEELGGVPSEGPADRKKSASEVEAKYAFKPSTNTEIKVYPFPSSSAADRGEIRLGWAPARTDSQAELRLLQLFLKALADGEQSLLYKSLIDSTSKELDSEATSIEAEVSLQNSPWFPAEFIALRGVPGNRMSVELIDKLRRHIVAKIATVSAYPDDSEGLRAFNQLVMEDAKAWERDQRVWIKSSPLFSSDYKTDWKEHLSYLEMDGSFVRSLSDKSVWQKVEAQVSSGNNPWRHLIAKFHLLEMPYAAASRPSPQLLGEMEQQRQARLQSKVEQLEKAFGVAGEQEALDRYEQSELDKTHEIDQIEARVQRPRFTEHPPLTPDDDIQYKQFRLKGVPVIAVLFQGTPTIDLGLSFDLRKIPRKYYKYLPILPRSFDSLGLKNSNGSTSYSQLLTETQRDLSAFSIEYSSNPISARADLAIRVSTASLEELQPALALVNKMTKYSDLETSNLGRLRDLVDERLAEDDRYGKGDDSSWFWSVSDAFRHQDDPLYFALNSRLTQAHWDIRLKWRLHKTVSPSEIESLHNFADGLLTSSRGLSSKELAERLSQLQVKGLEKELIQYWQRNIASFPESQLLRGLRQLTEEVRQDLAVGSAQTMKELKELQRIVVDRDALKVDITIDPDLLEQVTPTLTRFLQEIPAPTNLADIAQSRPAQRGEKAPIMRRIENRRGASGDEFPWYVGLIDSHNVTGGVAFSANFLGYSDLDRQSLIKMLSSKLVSGTGPHSVYMKTVESGLAYSNSIRSDPSARLLSYYADRIPDIASLVELVNSFAGAIPSLRDPSLVDYVLQRSFPFPRSMATFADRGKNLAQDIYDGNEPGKIRRFSESILKLKDEPHLFSEVTKSGLPSIGPVLLKAEFRDLQQSDRSVFFLVGPERLLADAEKRLAISRLLRLYGSDFWME